jgi:NAD(P)-dependent dehydrogenase (short-subunit alcohol dehydrogenase family)
MTSFSLDGQTAIVTGASRNIGAAIAMAMAEAGADLLLVARGREALEASAQRVREATGRRVETVVADVATPEGTERIVAAADEHGLTIDTLVNNAYTNGGTHGTTVFDAGDDAWETVLRTNVMGPARLARAFGRRMLDGDGGSIINVLSGSGFLASPGLAPYGASKAALWMLTRSIAEEGAPKVRANGLCPGGVTETGEPRNDAQRYHLPMVPMGRLGRPHEIAGAAVYLASPAASYTTGAVIVVNGGRVW